MKWDKLHVIILVESILIVVVTALLFVQLQKSESDTLSTLSEVIKSTTLPQVRSEKLPAEVLDLTNWKITLPIGSSEKPTEVKQPVLKNYELDPWFVVTSDGKAVRFRASVNSVTTNGSNYPRSELREMTDGGKTKAGWASTSGTHTMFLDQAITAVPKTKKHVVAGQIHDAEDDIIVIRLEYPNLYVNVDGDNVVTLDKNYTLGKRFTAKFVVHEGKTDVYYNNSTKPVYTLPKNYSNGYFKAGAYTQSNCNREASRALCSDDNYGEVVLYQLEVTHQ